MPHITIKMYPGRSDEQKDRLVEAITNDVVAIVGCLERSVSVSIEEVAPEEWAEKVYRPEVIDNARHLHKKPGYNPFEE